MTRKKTVSAGIAGALAAMAGVLRFALRGYDVIALILVAVAVLVMLWAFVGGAVFKVAAGVAAVLAIALALTEVPIVANSHTDAGDDIDYLVVLGARVDEDGNPSYSLLSRLEASLDYLDAHPEAKAVLSGGRGADEPTTEAACMYDWLVTHGLSQNRLIVEDESTNTYENLRNSFALISAGPSSNACNIAVVSSSYHLYRAKLIARSLGVDASGIASYPGSPVVALNYFIREAPAVWKQLLVGAR